MEEQSEIEIMVPWGQITCKTYPNTNSNNEIVLLIHDLNDNASSFDNLIPHLSKKFIYVAMDLPGHGNSSHAPPHSIYHYFDYILAIKYVIYGILKVYKQTNNNKKVVLIGHLSSVHLAIVFSQVYAKLVSKLILLEDVYDYGINSSEFCCCMKEILDLKYFQYENELLIKSPVEYSFEKVVKIYLKKYNEENATIRKIAERSCRKIDNGNYLLKNDKRLNSMIMHNCGYHYSLDLLKKLPVQCPILVLCNSETKKQHKEALNILQLKNNKIAIIKFDKANHISKYFHLKQPEKVADFINSFLLSNMSNKL